MKRGYRYRIYLTRAQVDLAERQLAACRSAFNHVVRTQREAVAAGDRVRSAYESCADITAQRNTPEGEWMKVASLVALQQAAMAADASYRRSLNSIGTRNPQRPPRIKVRSRGSHGMTFTRAAFAGSMAPRQDVGRRRVVKIPKLGEIEIIYTRDLPSQPSKMTLIREPDATWHISFVCEVEQKPMAPTRKVAGIDLGTSRHHVIEVSENGAGSRHEFTVPTTDEKTARRIRYEQKRLRRMEPGSGHHRRQSEMVARLYAKTKDRQRDHMRKTSLELLRSNDAVAVESLSIRTMDAHFQFAMRSVASQTFLSILRGKAELLGRQVAAVDTFFPSTQLCSRCGHNGGGLDTSIREWTCTCCGVQLHRDYNACANLIKESFEIVTAAGLVDVEKQDTVEGQWVAVPMNR